MFGIRDLTTFVLIHGGGGSSWCWHLVAPELRSRGFDVVAPDLPCDDDSASLTDYADAVVEAIGERSDLVVVGHSYGGLIAPLVADQLPVRLLVLVSGMIPVLGETPRDWWDNTGHAQAVQEQAVRRERGESSTAWVSPWPLPAWPNVPTKFVLCKDDRIFPADFFRRLVPERLGVTPDEIPGGHYVQLSRPK